MQLKKQLILFICIVETLCAAHEISDQQPIPFIPPHITEKLEEYYKKEKQESSTYIPCTIAAALGKALEHLNITDTSRLTPSNNEQKAFIERYLTPGGVDMLKGMSATELRSWASENIGMLNQILKKEGFDIQLVEQPDGFGVVSILKAEIEWKEKAEKSRVEHQGTLYDAIKLKNNKHDCMIMKTKEYPHPIAAVKTKTDDTIYFAVADKPEKGTELRNKILSLLRSKKKNISPQYDSVIVPMVDLNNKEKMDWLIGLRFTRDHYIAQALQQTKFKMNETGAKVENAVAIGVRCLSMPTKKLTYNINNPFFAWIVRKGMQEPYFSAYITPKDWKNPDA